jgi:hypothetical protein
MTLFLYSAMTYRKRPRQQKRRGRQRIPLNAANAPIFLNDTEKILDVIYVRTDSEETTSTTATTVEVAPTQTPNGSSEAEPPLKSPVRAGHCPSAAAAAVHCPGEGNSLACRLPPISSRRPAPHSQAVQPWAMWLHSGNHLYLKRDIRFDRGVGRRRLIKMLPTECDPNRLPPIRSDGTAQCKTLPPLRLVRWSLMREWCEASERRAG